MILSTMGNTAPTPALAGGLRFDLAGTKPGIEDRVSPLRAWGRPLQSWLRARDRSVTERGLAHALLADAKGVWAWAPSDRYAAATRYAGVRDWMQANPGTDMRLWVSGDLMHSLYDPATAAIRDEALLRLRAHHALVTRHGEAAGTWPLATRNNEAAAPGTLALADIDLEALCHEGFVYGVRVTSVVPWWYHAFVEAKRCVPRIEHTGTSHVCVVEGRQIAWVVAERGVISKIHHASLTEATVDALHKTMQWLRANCGAADAATVVLGQGLVDGGQTNSLDSLVLGRLDGEQPPQWLRPCTKNLH